MKTIAMLAAATLNTWLFCWAVEWHVKTLVHWIITTTIPVILTEYTLLFCGAMLVGFVALCWAGVNALSGKRALISELYLVLFVALPVLYVCAMGLWALSVPFMYLSASRIKD